MFAQEIVNGETQYATCRFSVHRQVAILVVPRLSLSQNVLAKRKQGSEEERALHVWFMESGSSGFSIEVVLGASGFDRVM